MNAIEKQREEFLAMIDSPEFLDGPWLAVCLFIPTEWLHELQIESSRVEELVESGKRILSAFDNGFYSRIGWSSFFGILKGSKQETSRIIASEIRSQESRFTECHLWRFSVASITDVIPKEVLSELEWRSHEDARSSGYREI